MAKVTAKEIQEKATEGRYGVGAFNAVNMEAVQAIVMAAKEERSPLILQFTSGAIKYAGIGYVSKLVEAALADADIPIAVHLDHGPDFELCKLCIDNGFSSVMIDGSSLPYEENVAVTKKVVEYAHERGESVEAELGKLAGVEDDVAVAEGDALYTDPDQALDFVSRTGCDTLAIAIGTSHGAYKFKGEAKLRIDILDKIREKVKIPLVLHGASSVPRELIDICNRYGGALQQTKGVPEEEIKEAIEHGISKINTDTDLRLAFTGGIRKEFAENPENFDLRDFLGPAREAVKETVKGRMKLFGSSNRA